MNRSKKLAFSNLAEKPLTIADWVVFFIIAFFCFVTFQQGDIFHTGGSSFAY